MIDPTQPAAPAAAAPQQGTICIAPLGDGTFMVYPEGTEPTGEPAQGMDAALEQAGQMLAGAGQAAPGSAETEAEELFTGGFNEASGRAPMKG